MMVLQSQRIRNIGLALVLVMAVLSAQTVMAQGITVTGHASVATSANRLIVRGKLEVTSELAGDALLEFAQARDRILKTMNGLEIKDLSVSGNGLKVEVKDASGGQGNRIAFGGGAPAAAEPEVVISELIEIKVSNLGQMDQKKRQTLIAKLLDESKEAGLEFVESNRNMGFSMPPSQRKMDGPGVMYGMPPAAEIEDEAFKIALADARSRAERLSRLAEVKLGPVTSIQTMTDAPGTTSKDANGTHDVKLKVVFSIIGQ